MVPADTYDATTSFTDRVSAALRALPTFDREVHTTPTPIRPQPRMRWTDRPGGAGLTARWGPER